MTTKKLTHRERFILGELLRGGMSNMHSLSSCSGVNAERVQQVGFDELKDFATILLKDVPETMYALLRPNLVRCKTCGGLLDAVPCFACWCIGKVPEYKYVGKNPSW